MKSSSTGEIKMWKKTTSHTHSKSAQLSTAAPRAISKSQITAPYLRNHIYELSAPEIGSSLSCAFCSSLEMLFICDYRHPLNKRCLCLRSKVFWQILNSSDSSERRVLKAEHLIWAGLLGVVCCRERDESVADGKYETRPQTSQTLHIAYAFGGASY